MALPTDTLIVKHWEGTDLVLLARVEGLAATPILQSTLDSIACKVFRKSTLDQVTPTLALTVGSVIFDTLQTDARWTVDATGYNFRYTLAGTYFLDGDTTYLVEVIGTPVTGQPFPLFVAEVRARELYSV